MKLTHSIGSVFISAALLGGPVSTALAGQEVPIYLTFDGETSEVLAWSWGASQSSSFHVGSGGGTGKASFQDLSITRLTDGQSPDFLAFVATGDSPAGPSKLTRGDLTIQFDPVLVTSYSVGGTADKKSPQTENISLNFQRVTYKIQGEEFCWNVAANKEC